MKIQANKYVDNNSLMFYASFTLIYASKQVQDAIKNHTRILKEEISHDRINPLGSIP